MDRPTYLPGNPPAGDYLHLRRRQLRSAFPALRRNSAIGAMDTILSIRERGLGRILKQLRARALPWRHAPSPHNKTLRCIALHAKIQFSDRLPVGARARCSSSAPGLRQRRFFGGHGGEGDAWCTGSWRPDPIADTRTLAPTPPGPLDRHSAARL